MSKFGLLSNLENPDVEKKKKYQRFNVQLGFEHINVCVPIENADLFLSEAERIKPKSSTLLTKIVESFGGHIE